MRPSFIPRLVNGPFGDPGLLVSLTFRKRALLFDLGDLSALSAGDILKTTHVFVTHTHMDHFVGFDQLLRLLLGRGKTLHMFGPKGFLMNLKGKLQAYTWNLVHNYDEGLTITATEIGSRGCKTQTFDCQKGFVPSAPMVKSACPAFALEEPQFNVHATMLDHQIPSLAFSLQERFHINILKPRLEDLGLEVGPWVSQFKQLVFQKADPSTEIEVLQKGLDNSTTAYAIGELAEKIVRITPGQKIAYVVDAVYNDENKAKILALAEGADHLFIEAAFLEQDRGIAKEKYHLTAYQAGTLARNARVREMSVFHHSPRYTDQGHLLREEAESAFRCG